MQDNRSFEEREKDTQAAHEAFWVWYLVVSTVLLWVALVVQGGPQ